METTPGGPALPKELWDVILNRCSSYDLTQVSLVNSQLLDLSRDILYHELRIKGYFLSKFLPALRNPEISRRLRRLTLDPHRMRAGSDDSTLQDAKDLFEILASQSQLQRLDIVRLQSYSEIVESEIQTMLALQFIQLPLLEHVTLDACFFDSNKLPDILQAKVLKDLEIILPSALQAIESDPTNFSGHRPKLDTFRIRNDAIFWKKVAKYADFSCMRRLAVWDYDQRAKDLNKEWGELIKIASSSLEYLSLWITPTIIEAPTYIASLDDFPRLRVLSLFLETHFYSLHWTTVLFCMIKSFHARSPSLQHIRLYIHTPRQDCSPDQLGEDSLFKQFANDISTLNQISSVKLSFYHSLSENKQDPGHIASLFQPVTMELEYNVMWDRAWPFFVDDHESFY
ncbi:hypothetical protein DL96DRAFT_1581533 [Flagelloscypha sp. PMI_526]|nr:hypothetical protein DL96DRAFT_1581533 [Flagelloscypha sp. PMI_526]